MIPGNAQDGRHDDAVPKHARQASGLTLLEVLAAFLIFSMVFTVLVGTSQRGVKSQGVGARRLLANEIADREMAELEVPMVERSLPLIPEDELEEDDFTIRIASKPVSGDDPNANSGFGGGSSIDSGDGLAALAAQFPEVSKYLYRYDIAVEWTEGVETQSVHRTTYALDWGGFVAEYAALFTQGGASAFAASAGGSAASAAAGGAAGASGSGTGSGSGAGGSDADRGRGAGAGSNSELQKIIADFCRDNAASAPEVCGGQ